MKTSPISSIPAIIPMILSEGDSVPDRGSSSIPSQPQPSRRDLVRPSGKLNDYYLIDNANGNYPIEVIHFHNLIMETLSKAGLRVKHVSERVLGSSTRIEMSCCGPSPHLWWALASEIVGEGVSSAHPICVYGCALCRYEKAFVKFGKTEKRFFENTLRHINDNAAVAFCPLGHKFLIEDVSVSPDKNRIACPVCKLESCARYTRHFNIRILDNVYTSRYVFLRFECYDCGAHSYTTPDFILGPNHNCAFRCANYRHMPRIHEEVINTKRAFEIVYGKRFDDYSSVLFLDCPPLGYNEDLRLAYYHLKHIDMSTIEKHKSEIEALGVKIFVIAADCVSKKQILKSIVDNINLTSSTRLEPEASIRGWSDKMEKNLNITGRIFNI